MIKTIPASKSTRANTLNIYLFIILFLSTIYRVSIIKNYRELMYNWVVFVELDGFQKNDDIKY